jgi:hypothetical protein
MTPVWRYSTGTKFRTVQNPDHRASGSEANEKGISDIDAGSRALMTMSKAATWEGENLSFAIGITLERDACFSAHFLTRDSSSKRSKSNPGAIGSDGQEAKGAVGGSVRMMESIWGSCNIVRFDTIRYPIPGEAEARVRPVISSRTVECSHASKL